MEISFTDFYLEGGDDCEYDGVAIFDGWTLSGVYCGSNWPPRFKSTGDFALVIFYSDSSVVYSGFSATVNNAPGKYNGYAWQLGWQYPTETHMLSSIELVQLETASLIWAYQSDLKQIHKHYCDINEITLYVCEGIQEIHVFA